MLKDFAETGQIHSHLNFNGIIHFPGCKYIGIETSCHRDEIVWEIQ